MGITLHAVRTCYTCRGSQGLVSGRREWLVRVRFPARHDTTIPLCTKKGTQMRFYLINLYYSLQAQYLWTRYSEEIVGEEAHFEFMDNMDWSPRAFMAERIGTDYGIRADWYGHLWS